MPAQSVSSPFAKVILMLWPGGPLQSGEEAHPLRRCALKVLQVLIKRTFAPHSIQINVGLYACWSVRQVIL